MVDSCKFIRILLVIFVVFAKSSSSNETQSGQKSTILQGIRNTSSNRKLNLISAKNESTKYADKEKMLWPERVKTRRYSFQPMIHLRIGNARIVGGTVVAPHSAPFIVFLEIKKEGSHNVFHCGGSIINEYTVLTAGHCLDKAEKIVVKAGKHQLDEEEEGEQVMESESFTLHEGYKNQPLAKRDDIGLIHLPEKLTFTKTVQPVQLADEEPEEKAAVESLGWGRKEDLKLSKLLQTATNHVIGDQEAKDSFGGLEGDKFICADMNEGTGTCDGDSGGPLLNDASQLVGATSFGHSDCLAEEPQCFASIPYYKDWIRENIQQGDLNFHFKNGRLANIDSENR